MKIASRGVNLGLAIAVAVTVTACGAQPDGGDDSRLGSTSPAGERIEASPMSADDIVVDRASAFSTDSSAARATLEAYYEAISAGDYPKAYRLWSDSGRASGQTAEEFAEGYAETVSVQATIGDGVVEGAAGSRYIELPVDIRATASDGSEQHFTGSYVLRRTVVDGASAEQRAWRIHSANISPAP